MLKLLKRLLPIIFIGVSLAACQKPMDTKHQLQADMQTVENATKQQRTALSTLETMAIQFLITISRFKKNIPTKIY